MTYADIIIEKFENPQYKGKLLGDNVLSWTKEWHPCDGTYTIYLALDDGNIVNYSYEWDIDIHTNGFLSFMGDIIIWLNETSLDLIDSDRFKKHGLEYPSYKDNLASEMIFALKQIREMLHK